jgi:putative peptidoglycan lipid II flippase
MVNRAIRMMAGTLASRVLGLLREILTASYFGATRSLDAYYVAYTLANLSRQLLAEGALSASFVPTFSRVHARAGRDAARRLARQVMTILTAAGASVVGLGILASPLLVKFIAPGFDASQNAMAVGLTRALFPFLLIVSLGALAMGVLNSVGSFFVPAIAPAASNLAFIIILVAFRRNISVWTMASAVLVGGLCNMALQWTMSWRMGYLLIPSKPDISNPDLRRTMSLFLPYAAGLSLNQINPIISRMLGSFLDAGVISVLNYADRIIQLPLGLFVIAISQAVLPMLSRLEPSDREGFQTFIRDSLRFNLFIVLPAASALVLLARPIVHILLVRGAFGEWAWIATTGALACYAAGLPGMACNTVIMRALYARGMPKAAVSVTAFTVCANLALGLLLMRRFSYMGLALGTSCAFTGAAFFGARLLSRDLGMGIGLFGPRWTMKLLGSCAAMCGALAFGGAAFPYPAAASLPGRAIWTVCAVALGGGLYSAITTMMKCPEWAWIKTALRRGHKIAQEG